MNKFFKHLSTLALALILTLGVAYPVSADEIIGSNELTTIELSKEEITSRETIVKGVIINGENVTLTVEDLPVIQLRNSKHDNFGNGTHSKRVTMSSITATMSATFNFTINPYIVTINSVSNGTYHSVAGEFIRDRYRIVTKSASNSDYAAIAKYEVDYTTYLGGTFLASLQMTLQPGGAVIYTIKAV